MLITSQRAAEFYLTDVILLGVLGHIYFFFQYVTCYEYLNLIVVYIMEIINIIPRLGRWRLFGFRTKVSPIIVSSVIQSLSLFKIWNAFLLYGWDSWISLFKIIPHWCLARKQTACRVNDHVASMILLFLLFFLKNHYSFISLHVFIFPTTFLGSFLPWIHLTKLLKFILFYLITSFLSRLTT